MISLMQVNSAHVNLFYKQEYMVTRRINFGTINTENNASTKVE